MIEAHKNHDSNFSHVLPKPLLIRSIALVWETCTADSIAISSINHRFDFKVSTSFLAIGFSQASVVLRSNHHVPSWSVTPVTSTGPLRESMFHQKRNGVDFDNTILARRQEPSDYEEPRRLSSIGLELQHAKPYRANSDVATRA
jgi:hypothetical protein